MAVVIAAMMLVLSMSTMAFAADVYETTKEYNVTINSNKHESFKAIQIFTGTQEITGTDNAQLGNIEWARDVSGKTADIISAVNSSLGLTDEDALPDNTEAKIVAEKIATASTTQAIALSKALDAVIGSLTGVVIETGNNKLPVGYYLIVDTSELGNNDAKNMSLLQMTRDITITPKTDAPEIKKELKNDGETDDKYRDVNNVKIGDKVDYRITSEVPDMTYYDQYYFIVTDTLSKGLTYNEDMVVKVGNDLLSSTDNAEDTGKTYKLNITNNANGSKTYEIVFSNFKQYEKYAKVEITYTATLNSEAVVGTAGNTNEVDLTYSNNPNKKGDGKNKPGDEDDDVTGTTPKDWTETYTTNVKIKKIDASTKAALAGVTFNIAGYIENDVATYTEVYEETLNGNFYKLNDESYTTKAPTALTSTQYASTTQKYSLTVKKGTTTTVTPLTATAATTDANGMIDIGAVLKNSNVGSVAAGKLVITEATTLAGYNLLDEAIIVELSHTVNGKTDGEATIDAATNCVWTSTKGTWSDTEKAFVIEVENSKGSTLPETGGIGTTLFYVIGAILVLGAGIILVSKKRMSAE